MSIIIIFLLPPLLLNGTHTHTHTQTRAHTHTQVQEGNETFAYLPPFPSPPPLLPPLPPTLPPSLSLLPLLLSSFPTTTLFFSFFRVLPHYHFSSCHLYLSFSLTSTPFPFFSLLPSTVMSLSSIFLSFLPFFLIIALVPFSTTSLSFLLPFL